jgi:succinoglycan biosynthesis transport protein ExoP
VGETDRRAHVTEESTSRPTSLADYVGILRRRKWVLASMVILTPLAALTVSLLQRPLYQATAQVYVNRTNIVSAITNVADPSTIGISTDPNRFLTTQSEIARSSDLAAKVVAAAGVRGMTVQKLLDNSTVAASADSDFLNVSVSNLKPYMAIRLANAYAQQYTSFKTELDTARINDALKTLRERVSELAARGVSPLAPSYSTVLQYESQLETVGKLLANNTQVTQPAKDATKIRPRTKRNAFLGLLLGGVLGIGLAFLAEALDRRVRTEHEIEEALGLPLLARIPRPRRSLQKANDLVMLTEPGSVEAEAFRKLRTNIEFLNLERQARSFLVTSAVSREGKSTTISNLGVSLARAGRKVALVDLDLRRPFLDKFFKIPVSPGLTDVVVNHMELRDAMQSIALTPRQGFPGSQGAMTRNGDSSRRSTLDRPSPSSNGGSRVEGILSILPAGTPISETGEFVGHECIATILNELTDEFEYVLIDAPPLLAVGDALTLSAKVDVIFAVARLKMAQRTLLHEFARQLETCQANKLGFVLAGAELEEGYGYGYYYGYESESERVRDRVS